jgi:mRNA-degrading endonuclease toxin of MazEF toxin-antitoxin module
MTGSEPAINATPVRRGEIWWVNFDPTQGSEIRKTRPAIVVTANAVNRARRTVVVVPLSTGPQPQSAHRYCYPLCRAKFGCSVRSGAGSRQAAPD